MSMRLLVLVRRSAIAASIALLAVLAFVQWRGIEPPMIITGKADVGGPFRLTDQNGRTITNADLHGRPLVIYFGWSLDPDLTPAALQVMAAAVQRLGPKADRLSRVFISIDPQRDTPAALHSYVTNFMPGLIGLVGTAEDTPGLAKSFKLYFKRVADPALPGGYSIDHASLYYLMGADGAFRGLVPHTTDVAVLTRALDQLLK